MREDSEHRPTGGRHRALSHITPEVGAPRPAPVGSAPAGRQRTTAVLLLGAATGAAALAPAALAVAPGANGRIANFGYSAGAADSWVEQFDPLGGGLSSRSP
jgi:hypothetical protein